MMFETNHLDEHIRLYKRDHCNMGYMLRNTYSAPYVGWSILDLVVSPDRRSFIYSTWSERCLSFIRLSIKSLTLDVNNGVSRYV